MSVMAMAQVASKIDQYRPETRYAPQLHRYYDMFEQSGWYYGNKSASSSCTAYTGNSWVT
jgi:hypothetical protein